MEIGSTDLTASQRLLKALDNAAVRLETLERAKREPIAIIGLGCRFPGGADDPQSFWEHLQAGMDAIGEVPPARWRVEHYYSPQPAPGKMCTRHGGFLADVASFDAKFFGISAREALSMDPQQRLLLEVSWEALEHAGQPPDRLRHSATGVFIGATATDYTWVLTQAAQPDLYFATGNTLNAIAGRLSYLLDLQGPSLAVDTACSSSLVAVHLACQSLRQEECELALAGGVNLLLSPQTFAAVCQAQMLSPDGRCKTFDAAANGYGRGEGCGVVVLKRLSQAQADGDRILALIRGSAVNQDGRSSGFTVPYGPAQQDLIRCTLKRAQVAAADVDYLEAHGTGTPLGDPIEVNAATVYVASRPAQRPLLIGSVKTNLGHLEAAAGIAGLIKVVLALVQEAIPPHLHFKQPNPHIPWQALPVEVPTRLTPWPRGPRPRRAGISSFGVSGTNAHLIVEEAPDQAPPAAALPERPLHLLALSAKDTAALRQLAARYREHLDSKPDAWADTCFSANTGRCHFRYRLPVVASSAEEASRRLAAWLSEDKTPDPAPEQRPKLAFLFTGQGAQYLNMGQRLYETEPVFRHTLERCDALLRPWLSTSLLAVLYPPHGADSPLNETAYTQPALFALEYALARLWQRWGIEPDALIGHSLGEYVAACLAGVFSLEDGLRLVAERARLMQTLPRKGAMATVFADEAQVAAAIGRCSAALAIAAVNAPENIVLSGEREALAAVLGELAAAGVPNRPLPVSHAFHSPLLDPLRADLRAVAETVRYQPPRLPLVSNLTGQLATAAVAGPEYWVEHARQPVRFAAGMATLAQQGCRVFLEIGPKPILLHLGHRCLQQGLWLPSLRPAQDWQTLLDSLAALYGQGFPVDWAGLYGQHRARVTLPTYPFQRQRYWPEGGGERLPAATGPDPAPPKDWFYTLRWRAQLRLGLPPEYLPPLTDLAAAVQDEAERRLAEVEFLDYWQVLERLEELSVDYVVQALQALGWDFPHDKPVTAAALAEHLGVIRGYRRLFDRLLEILGEAGILASTSAGWTAARPPPRPNPEPMIKQLAAQCPAASAELTLLARCGGQLAAVLRGAQDPLELLFPKGNLTTAASLYQDSPAARWLNSLVRTAVETAVATLPQERGLRLLEIGAGTGGTSAYVLPMLPPDRTEYVYTDISPLFLSKAQEKFQHYPFIRYQTLDIEKDPIGQGLAGQCFDLCIAANVLHATRDLSESLSHVRRLLAPGGLLLLLEGTGRLRFLDLIFGLTEGWWRFTDTALRPAHPLLDRAGWQAVLERSGFEQALPLASASGLLAKQTVIGARVAPATPAHWLILADAAGLGERLADRLRRQGETCTLARAGEVGTLQAMQELLASAPWPAGIVHLWSLDAPTPEALTVASLDAAVELGCRSLLHLLQALTRQGTFPALWLVTRGAVAAAADDALPGLAQAPLWGMARSLRLEHPAWRCVQLDLDPNPTADPVEALWEEIHTQGPEDQIALRGQSRYLARLTRTVDLSPIGSHPVRADGSYLITGGLRGLGPWIARWLAEQGARHLLLLGRRLPDAAGQAILSALPAQGVRVMERQADVADPAQLGQVLAEATATLPPLRGVIHAAGILDDGVLLQQDWERFRRVLAPKVVGAWHLHTLLREQPLDWFVLFASAAGLLGSPGQANHAAANAFLDALAWHRHGRGLPGLSIDWGPWSEVGAAAEQQVAARISRKGLGNILPRQGLQALGQALAGAVPQLGIWPVDWRKFREQFPGGPPPLLAELLAEVPIDAAAPRGLRSRLEAATGEAEREALLVHYVQECVRKMLLLDPARTLPLHRPLNELGLDSLVSTELKNHFIADLGVDVPMETLLSGASSAQLAALLAERLSVARLMLEELPRRDGAMEELTL